ncbi:hypothetical protein IJ095_02580 [Candidatus Saccharibacteria bacterium]|nr:hypothetical protein [Candidatus Saccharibacteria bacterium]
MSRVAEDLAPRPFGDLDELARRAVKPMPTLSKETEESAERARAERNVTTKEYWQRCLNLIKTIGDYNQKKKNYLNSIDPSKAHIVREKLIVPYYSGEARELREHRDKHLRVIWQQIDALNHWVIDEKLGVELIDGDLLLGMTVNSNDRAKFRHHLEKLRDQLAPPYALTEVPNREFRQMKKSKS